jgi:hypothetical protein
MPTKPVGFLNDVFLSYSSKDGEFVQALAERLQSQGVRVWMDRWNIRPGDPIMAKIDEGLEHSRAIVLCMSGNAFGSDWSLLESQAVRFRDPLNRDRRLIPVRLDDAAIPGSLESLSYIDGTRGIESVDDIATQIILCLSNYSVQCLGSPFSQGERKQVRVVSGE